ncbi:MAG: thioredoxin family protein [Chitinophagaceae bacterium]|nr:thioredoxin family protein [Chitinophagaceae bacterium]
MKKLFLIGCLLMSTLIMQAQDFVRELDRKSGKVLLRGKFTFDDLKDETTCKWLDQGAKSYKPNAQAIKQLKPFWENYRLVIFGGTWCEDTRDLLPKLYRVLNESAFDFNAIEMYGVNRDKEALNIESKLYNIQRVPTIIIMHQYREVGRIIETVQQSIEDDLLHILENDADKLAKSMAH